MGSTQSKSTYEDLDKGTSTSNTNNNNNNNNSKSSTIVSDEKLLDLIKNTNNIRNIAIISRVDHGKSVFIKCLKDRFSFNQDKTEKYPDYYNHLKNYYTPIILNDESQEQPYLINLLNIPNQHYQGNRVIPFLRVTDICIIVVDTVEGLMGIPYLPFKPIKQECTPVLFLNKLDRLLLELQMDPCEMKHTLERHIERINTSFWDGDSTTTIDDTFTTFNILFGSGLQGWGFTIQTFASLYSAKFGVAKERMAEYLWGEHFFDAEKKKWVSLNVSESGKPLRNGFSQFICQPIVQISRAVIDGKKDVLDKMLASLHICLPDQNLQGKALFIEVMNQFLPIDKALLNIVANLPSPIQAQAKSIPAIYNQPIDDPCTIAMQSCDPNGPIMMYISHLLYAGPGNSQAVAFGRVFSGTLRKGIKVRVLDDVYRSGPKTKDVYFELKDLLFVNNNTTTAIKECPSGNLVALFGMNHLLSKSGTITDHKNGVLLSPLSTSTTPVVKVTIDPVNANCHTLLNNCLTTLVKCDPSLCFYQEGQSFILEGLDQEHLEWSIYELQCTGKVHFTVSEQRVCYRECVSQESKVFADSGFGVKVQPLSSEYQNNLNSTEPPSPNVKKVDWSPNSNVIENITTTPFGNSLDSYVTEFRKNISNSGVMTGEPLQGVQFSLVDKCKPNTINDTNIMSRESRLLKASLLDAKPILLEPIYLIEMYTEKEYIDPITTVINSRSGSILSSTLNPCTNVIKLLANVSVANSFGLVCEIRSESRGTVTPNMVFDKWSTIGVIGENQIATQLAIEIKTKKGLTDDFPTLNDFILK
ncbi:hypothetical protein CYY_000087 [Polysphondylium violaceum]|uniref:Elongation factor EFG domain-containing protein n=1 Tax=Polysphondylium violaceum TaxID=133409 RepID=A0A8J4V9B5_9MYCE|nr:hypothetical protein CYY_000087 [Polysphondylium violaceum]